MSSAVQAKKNSTEASAARSGYATPKMGSACTPREAENLPDEVVKLHTAWEQYWQDATRFWERLLDCFRNSGDQNSLKGWCISEGVHNIIGQDLANLRTALREVCHVCGPSTDRATLHPGGNMLSGHRLLFEVLLELVSAGGVAGFQEGQAKAPSWQAVRALLTENSRVNGGQGQAMSSHMSSHVRSHSVPPAVSMLTMSGFAHHSPVTWRTSGAPTHAVGTMSLAQAAATGALAMPFNHAAQILSSPSTPLGVASYTVSPVASMQPGNGFLPFEPSPSQNSARLAAHGSPTKAHTNGLFVGQVAVGPRIVLH